MNLLFSMDRNYIPIFLNCLKSVLKNGGYDFYNIYILHSDLEESHFERIRSFTDQAAFHFIYVDPALFEGFPVTARYPAQIYYRLAAPILLPEELERILYLDGDTIIINSLQELYSMDFEDNLIISCSHTGIIMNSVNQVRLGMEKNVPYINSGVMVYNLPKLRKTLSLDDIRAYAKKRDLFLILPDQDILTALYGTKIKVADWRKYNLGEKSMIQNNLDPSKENIDLDWIAANTSVIHYFGKNKPWKPGYNGQLGVFFENTVLEKTLIMISGTMGAGKSDILQAMKPLMRKAVFLEGEWCCDLHPYQDTPETRRMAVDNIVYLLNNFIACSACKTIVFSWVMDDEAIINKIKSRLNLYNVKVISIALIPEMSRLIEGLSQQVNDGLQDDQIIVRAVSKIPAYYQHTHSYRILCKKKDPDSIAREILILAQNKSTFETPN